MADSLLLLPAVPASPCPALLQPGLALSSTAGLFVGLSAGLLLGPNLSSVPPQAVASRLLAQVRLLRTARGPMHAMPEGTEGGAAGGSGPRIVWPAAAQSPSQRSDAPSVRERDVWVELRWAAAHSALSFELAVHAVHWQQC